jgi:hypothetical protein
MLTIDEMTDAQKAWVLWKKLKEIQSLLWELYHSEFMALETREASLTINPDAMPF